MFIALCITLYPIRICTGCVARSSKRERRKRESKSLASCAAVSAELSSPLVRLDGRMVLLLQGHEPFPYYAQLHQRVAIMVIMHTKTVQIFFECAQNISAS